MRSWLAILLVLSAVAAASAGCAPSAPPVAVSGRVADVTIAVGAPALPVPAPIASPTAAGAHRSADSTVAALVGLGRSVRVASVEVQVGDRVRAGQALARLDTEALDAAVASARAAQRSASAHIDVIDERLDEVADARSTIATSRGTVTDTIEQLEQTRAELAAQLRDARAQRERIRAILDSLPPSGGVLPPGSTLPSGAVLPPGAPLPDPAQLAEALAQLEAGIAKLEAGIARIDGGLAQARQGLDSLSSASAQAADARTALERARRLATAGLDARDAAISLAEATRDLGVLRSPAAGVVISAVQPGETVAPGAPVVAVRPDRAASVDVWVAPEDAATLATGDEARVRIDSRPDATYEAEVAVVGARALFPPTWVATTDVHLTRAVPVRVALTDLGVTLPAGTPADVEIDRATNP